MTEADIQKLESLGAERLEILLTTPPDEIIIKRKPSIMELVNQVPDERKAGLKLVLDILQKDTGEYRP